MKLNCYKINVFELILHLYYIQLIYSSPTIQTLYQTENTDHVDLTTEKRMSEDNIFSESNILIEKNWNVSAYDADKAYNFETLSRVKKGASNTGISNTYLLKCEGCQLDLRCNETISGTGRLSQTQFMNILTSSCRYDRLERPLGHLDAKTPIKIYVRFSIKILQNLAAGEEFFTIKGLLKLRYTDPRLAFENINHTRDEPLIGQGELRSLIWVPHILVITEQISNILDTTENDLFTSIQPDGTVLLSTKIHSNLYCSTSWKKFPFDNQECSLDMESWMYNTSDLLLYWEEVSPVVIDPKIRLSEYTIENYWHNENIINVGINNMRRGLFVGNYSSLNLSIILIKDVGCGGINYFIPSMMIVAISWVSFWLQPDQTPARTTLGTSTMLSFITLASSQHKKLPPLSSVKLSEVWFIGCTIFIFGSLVEFAFVNTIWRRKKNIELEKVNSKYIFKSTLTPTIRKRIAIETDRPYLYRKRFKNQKITLDCSNVPRKEEIITTTETKSFSKMTPHQVSLWIDRKSRFLFPLAFIIFNAIFWTLTYSL